jgi:hypothetical protein
VLRSISYKIGAWQEHWLARRFYKLAGNRLLFATRIESCEHPEPLITPHVIYRNIFLDQMHRSSIQFLRFTVLYRQYLFTIHRDIASE